LDESGCISVVSVVVPLGNTFEFGIRFVDIDCVFICLCYSSYCYCCCGYYFSYFICVVYCSSCVGCNIVDVVALCFNVYLLVFDEGVCRLFVVTFVCWFSVWGSFGDELVFIYSLYVVGCDFVSLVCSSVGWLLFNL
jgi:hypothetical protein